MKYQRTCGAYPLVTWRICHPSDSVVPYKDSLVYVSSPCLSDRHPRILESLVWMPVIPYNKTPAFYFHMQIVIRLRLNVQHDETPTYKDCFNPSTCPQLLSSSQEEKCN